MYTNKKLMFTLTVLATPFVAENILEENQAKANGQSSTYALNNNVRTYSTAQAASAKTSPKSTYAKGDYYVYKTHQGMLNLSKVSGRAGAWINPSDNGAAAPTTSPQPQVSRPNQTQSETRKSSAPTTNSAVNGRTYQLNSAVRTYITAADASRGVNSRSTLGQGTYHVFKEYNGMLNLSRVAGRAGAWINPANNGSAATSAQPQVSRPNQTQSETRKSPAPTTNSAVNGRTYQLNSAVRTYITAADASRGVNARSTLGQGTYHIFREYNGMLNLSRVAGRAGAWINPANSGSVAPRTSAQPQETQRTTSQSSSQKTTNKYDGLEYKARFELTSDTAAYSNASNAKARVGATSRYAKGSYFIYKNVNGMLNISKTPGKAGAWINPNATSSIAGRSTSSNNTGSTGLTSFQYKNLNSKSNYTAAELNKALNAFGGASGKLAGRGDAFKKAESSYNVNALYLLSHAALESGWGKSKIAADKNNFFGIAAYDNSPYESATTFDGVEAGIMDGAKWISGRYLKSTSFPAAGAYLGDKTRGMNKHYATDPNWGYKIADIMNRINNYLGKKDN